MMIDPSPISIHSTETKKKEDLFSLLSIIEFDGLTLFAGFFSFFCVCVRVEPEIDSVVLLTTASRRPPCTTARFTGLLPSFSAPQRCR